jgi:SHS2 domain-containing protein
MPAHPWQGAPYELIDHTADLGIRVRGDDAAALFANAGEALFDVIVGTALLYAREHRQVRAAGEDWPDLMVNWLRELLALWTLEGFLVKTVTIRQICEQHLSAVVGGESYDPRRHAIENEVKAVTYHQASVRQASRGWRAQIIFDV